MTSRSADERDRGTRILHLSDPHMTGSGYDADGVDTVHAMSTLLAALDEVEDIDLVITTGDLADDGSPEGCLRVLDAVGGFARARGVPHIYTTGNHDNRSSFEEVFGTGHLTPQATDHGTHRAPSGVCGAVSDADGLRIITLDSLVPGAAHGELGEAQLQWLAEVLRSPAPSGTVIALHHPPLQVERHPLQSYLLRDVEDLGEVLVGTDARVILCGHVHHQMAGALAGIPVLVAPGIVTRIDLAAPSHVMRGVLGAGASLTELLGTEPPLTYTLSARDPRAGEVVYQLDTRSVPF